MVDARVRPVARVVDLVDSILNNTNHPVILIVCSSHARFVEQLSAELSTRSQAAQNGVSIERKKEEEVEKVEETLQDPETEKQTTHPLLTKTIGVLANSKRVRLAFCSSLEHLRAYLSTLQAHQSTDQSGGAVYGSKIVILDLLALHYMSSEFSAQGLSRTLALAVETAASTTSALLLCECEDAVVLQNPNRGHRLWDVHLPILSGPSRTEDGGRKLSARHVAQRWFRFDDTSSTMEN